MRCTSHSKLRYISHLFSQCDVRRIGLWGVAVALERAPWTLVQEWGERVTCLVVTRSKLNGLVGLLYEHYGRSAAGVKRSLIWSCVLCVM